MELFIGRVSRLVWGMGMRYINLLAQADARSKIVRGLRSRYAQAPASVRCIKHNYPDHHDKSERHKRGQRYELLPVIGLWAEPPNLSVTAITAFSQDQCFALAAPWSPMTTYLQ
jgi:hypothetical protein